MIEINNLTTQKVKEGFLKEAAKKVLQIEGKENSELSVVLTGPGRIRQLNKKYRGKNKATDVLSFSSSKIFPNSGKENNLGEIIICLKEIKKNAKKYQTGFEKELVCALVHGILHLLGYEHEKSAKNSKKMKTREDFYGKQIFQFYS